MDFSLGYLLSSLMIGMAGMAFFLYGKKAQRFWPLLAGLAMSIYPFFVASVWALWGITAAVVAGVWFMRER